MALLKSAWKRSTPIININKNQINSLSFFDGSIILGINLLSGGLRNSNYQITTNSGEYILRIYHDSDRLGIEKSILELVSEKVPVPDVYDTGTLESGSDGHAYMIMQFLEGVTLASILPELSNTHKINIYADLGRILFNIQSYTFDKSGFFDESLQIRKQYKNTPFAYFLLFEEVVVTPEVKDNLDGLYLDLVDYTAKHQSKMNQIDLENRLVHSDFNPENILVDPSSLEITAILDWEFSLAHNPMMDVGNLLRFEDDLSQPHVTQFITAFENGGAHLPKDWKIIIRLFDLIALGSMLQDKKIGKSKKEDILSRIRHYLAEEV